MKHYDYIICGGGMAGLSLAYYLKQSKLRDKNILIIEPEEKHENDRTWAFWEKTPGAFENVIYRHWDAVQLIDTQGNVQTLEMGKYKYKLLRGIDFYKFVLATLKDCEGIEWQKEAAISITEEADGAIVKTESGLVFKGRWVFDSTYRLNLGLAYNHNLLQHFKGYVVKTKEPFFEPDSAVMMNFNIEQQDDCRFVYVLPFDKHTALVEYTLFSKTLLKPDEYDSALKKYLSEQLGIHEYEMVEEEFGVIPMSDVATKEFPGKHVVRIGTAGGYTNPATGYTFRYTQDRLQQIVKVLEQTGSPELQENWFNKRFRFYASVLLNVLEQKRYSAAGFFARLYRRNPPVRVFRFLDGDTHLWEELKLMNTVPKLKFMAAVADVLIRKIKARFSGQPRP